MGPPGSRIIAHAKGTTRKSWDFWGKIGFYISPSLVYYRCYNLIRRDTQAVVVSDTVVFQHHPLTIPELTTDGHIIHCLRSLTEAIPADRSPSRTNDQLHAIESLCAILAPHARAIEVAPPGHNMPLLPITPPALLPRAIKGVPNPRVDIDPAPIPRVACNIPREIPQTIQPIAQRTRSHSNAAVVNTVPQKVSFSLQTITRTSTAKHIGN